MPAAILLSFAACAPDHPQPAPLQFDLGEVAARAAPQSATSGVAVSHEQGGDRQEGEWVALDRYSTGLPLVEAEIASFADRFCAELGRYLGERTAVTGNIDTPAGSRTVRRGDGAAETTTDPDRRCAYRIDRGWVTAYVVVVDSPRRAFANVDIVRL